MGKDQKVGNLEKMGKMTHRDSIVSHPAALQLREGGKTVDKRRSS
jgi:hypothetical protein